MRDRVHDLDVEGVRVGAVLVRQGTGRGGAAVRRPGEQVLAGLDLNLLVVLRKLLRLDRRTVDLDVPEATPSGAGGWLGVYERTVRPLSRGATLG